MFYRRLASVSLALSQIRQLRLYSLTYSVKVEGLVLYSKAAKGLGNSTIVLNKALVEVIEA
jgi:hypothetical protein